MSDVGDDDLLNDEEFDYEDYDITNEKEAALLQDEESNHLPEHEENSEKKGSEDDNEDDVLDIDLEAEEELDDTDDKNNQSTENRQYRKFSSEKSSTVSPSVTNSAPAKVTTSQNVKKNVPNSNKQIPTINKPKPHSNVPPKFVRRRGVGSGRGNFQTRPTFARNTSQRGRQERRNGKVYINPKYEGIVPINETNGRLAWDNPNFPQPNSTQTIQPWLGNATLELNFADPTSLISNLLAINSAQSAMQMQPQIKNTFEPPPQVAQGYQHSNLTFQPPTHTAPMQPYDTHNQVTGRPFGSQMPGLLPTPQQFNSQPVNRMQDYNNYYNRQQTDYGYGTNRPDNFKTSNYSKPVDFAVKSFNYGNYLNKNYGNDFQSKTYNSTYSGDVANKNSTYGNDSFQNRNLPSTSNFAKPYINPGKQGDYSKNQNLKTGDYNRDHLAYPQKSGDYKSNENQTYNTPRNQNLNYYAKPQNYNTSARPDSYQNLNYNKRWEVPKSNYDQNQIFTRRPKPNYDTRSNNSGDMNYTEESFDNTNFKSNNTQNQSYNRNVSNYNRPNNQSVSNEVVDIKIELPNKKIKMEEESEKKSEAKQQPAPADNKVVFEEEDDEETRLYRLKIEEQKKERERILKMKEERRKQALLEAEKEERRKQALLEVKNRQNVMLAAQKLDTQPKMAPKPNYQKRNYHQQMSNNIPVLSTETTVDSSPDKLSNFTFNVQNDLQKSAAASQKTESVSFMSNRVVLVKNSQKSASSYSSNVVKTVPVTEGCSKPDDVGQNLSSFFNNRKVLKKDNSLPSTRLVVINNLATSTNENKIVAMTKGIGEIQTLRMDKQERQATILFKTVASAHAFFKKYQRHMLDLSMIEVKLENLI